MIMKDAFERTKNVSMRKNEEPPQKLRKLKNKIKVKEEGFRAENRKRGPSDTDLTSTSTGNAF
jgi:hypothetical protein